MQNAKIRKATAVLVFMLVATAAKSATYTWSGGSSGAGDAWRQGNNWSPVAPQGGPGSNDIAMFTTNGGALSIGINFNDGRGLTNAVASIVLTNGPDRTIFNNAPNSAGTLRLGGTMGLLLANYSASSVLTLLNGSNGTMRIDLAAGGTVHVGAATAAVVLGGEVTGLHGFTKTGAGLLQLTRSNSLAGSVVVSGGQLELASAEGGSLAAASGLRLEIGASALLAAPRQFGAATSLDLAGGTLRGAFGSAPVEEQAGSLTLSANSTINLRASAIRFADSSAISWQPSSILTITNWQSVPGGGLFFGTGGLTSTQLAQIYFADLGIRGAQLVGPSGELVPVPEVPATAAAFALIAVIAWRERRRLACWRRCLSESGVDLSSTLPTGLPPAREETSPRGCSPHGAHCASARNSA